MKCNCHAPVRICLIILSRFVLILTPRLFIIVVENFPSGGLSVILV